MSFRRRTVMLAAGAVAAAVVIASVVVYFVTRDELVSQIDASLREKPRTVAFTGLSAATGPAPREGSEGGAPGRAPGAKGPGTVHPAGRRAGPRRRGGSPLGERDDPGEARRQGNRERHTPPAGA